MAGRIDQIVSDVHRRVGRASRAALAVVLATTAGQSGCYHWVPLEQRWLPTTRTEQGLVRYSPSTGPRHTLREASTADGTLSGIVLRSDPVTTPTVNAVIPVGTRVDLRLATLSEVEVHRLNGEVTAAVIAASVAGAGLTALVLYIAAPRLGVGFSGGFGRRPAGLTFGAREAQDSELGALLAAMAELERGSVPAFERLACELEALGAPRSLVARARIAAEDERRHADVMTTLAEQRGGAPRPVEVSPIAPRSVEELAIENAVEGCVHECWGAMVAAWQARTAGDFSVRAALGPIARDEASHAALANDIDAWAMRQLDHNARARVSRARGDAIARLRAEWTCGVGLADAEALGLPSLEQARALFDEAAPLLATG